MSHEVASADAALTALHHAQAEIARLTSENDRLLIVLEAATGRAYVASEAYNRQQASQRELEALYQAACERVIAAETELRALQSRLVDWIAAEGTPDFPDADESLAELARGLAKVRDM